MIYIPDELYVNFFNQPLYVTNNKGNVIISNFTYKADSKLKFEKSFNRSHDKNNFKIKTIKNDLISGFTINKSKNKYNLINTWMNSDILISDPRDINFYITQKNLMNILLHHDVHDGVIQGELRYGFSDKNIILISPKDSDYNQYITVSSLNFGKIKKTDLSPGCLYITKQGQEYLYLGKYPYWNNLSNSNYYIGEPYIFYNKSESKFTYLTSLNYISAILSNNQDPDFKKILNLFFTSPASSKYNKLIATEQEIAFKFNSQQIHYIYYNNKYYSIYFQFGDIYNNLSNDPNQTFTLEEIKQINNTNKLFIYYISEINLLTTTQSIAYSNIFVNMQNSSSTYRHLSYKFDPNLFDEADVNQCVQQRNLPLIVADIINDFFTKKCKSYKLSVLLDNNSTYLLN